MAATKYYTEEKYNVGTAIVIGSEGFGINRLVKENCDFLIKIPMKDFTRPCLRHMKY